MPTGLDVPGPLRVAADATVVPHTGDATLAASDMNKNHTNTGASGTAVLTLPAVASVQGGALCVFVTAAQIVRLLPQTGEAIYLAGSGVVSKYLNIAGVIGNTCQVFCDGTKWKVLDYSGVVTKEA